jgi:hypothetical protein
LVLAVAFLKISFLISSKGGECDSIDRITALIPGKILEERAEERHFSEERAPVCDLSWT